MDGEKESGKFVWVAWHDDDDGYMYNKSEIQARRRGWKYLPMKIMVNAINIFILNTNSWFEGGIFTLASSLGLE